MFGVSMRLNLFQSLGIALGSTFVLSTNCALGQIVPDGTLLNNSIININGNTFNITGGTQAGSNLFHSFKDFSVPTGGEAFFNNTVDITNIISRVTGGSVSSIDGLIRTLGTANLFLINPNGIVFGRNASLNVGGSFLASTANAIQFGDIGFFSATNPEAPSPLLTINPSALVSNQIAAAIQNNSIAPAGLTPTGVNASGLRVPDGRSLLLVGGDINMDGGRLGAYGGRVELGGLADSGTLGLEVNGNNLSLRFPDNATRASVSFTNGANINVSAAGGGSIVVNARNLDISGGSSLLAGIGQGLGSVGSQAGDITLNATGEIKVVGSYVFNDVRSQAVGNGGNINITTSSLSLTDLAQIAASTSGQGDAGSVSVRASDSVSVATAAIFSTVERGAVGNGGNININATTVSLKDSAQLLTIVREASDNQPAGRGDAGNVTVNVTGKVTIAGVNGGFDNGIFSSVRTGATGNGGNITISSGSFSLTNGGALAASTYGQGNAGNVSVRATDSVELAGGATISSNVEEGGVGKGGNVNINAATLSLKDNAQLQTLVREASDNQPAGRGDAGNVTVDVTGKVTIAGAKDGSASGISSRVRTGATGNGGNITISSGSLSLSDGALVIASTYGQGNAGNVSVQATDSVELSGGSMTGIVSTVESGAVGNGGNININAATLSLKDDAQLQTLVRGASDNQPPGRGNAGNVTVDVTGKVTIAGSKDGFPSAITSFIDTGATGNGGNITISSDSFSLGDGALLFASTYGQGNAGNVSVRATDSVELANTAGIFSAVEPAGVGKGGNININTATLSLKDGAQITASSTGDGAAGNIEVAARSMRLDNGSIISANTVAGQGNINLRARDLLLLRRGSNITTNATGTATGGNITINTPSGFIIAIPNENSDITANAFTGAGGRVDITTQGIYGIESRPRQTFLSDITASSERGISGKVTINRPDVDESLGLVELPTVLAGTSELIAETSCAAVASTDSDTAKSRFTFTGRGGLPPSPYEPLSSDVVWLDTRLSDIPSKPRSETPASTPPTKAMEIVPATGWVFDGKGNVTLISHASNAKLGSTPACQKK